MKHIARQPLRTIIERIKRKAPCTYTYMYDIVQHVAGTSNAIARGSDSDGFEKLRDTGFRLYVITALKFDMHEAQFSLVHS